MFGSGLLQNAIPMKLEIRGLKVNITFAVGALGGMKQRTVESQKDTVLMQRREPPD